MSARASLERRLSAGLALAVALTWVAAAVVAGFVVRQELGEAFDRALQKTAQRLLPLAVTEIAERDGKPETPPRRVIPRDIHEELLAYMVRDKAGHVLLQSADATPLMFPARPVSGYHDTSGHRVYGEKDMNGEIFIEVADPFAHRREALRDAISALLLPLVALVPLSVLAVWGVVRYAMRPLVALNLGIGQRGGGDLSPVAAPEVPREIAPIVEAVNGLLERLRRALEAERSFTANSAHELRTPIAAALAQTQRLIAEAPQGRLHERARSVERALQRLVRLSEKLLQLAKAEGGGLVAETAGDLTPVLAHVIHDIGRTGQGRPIRLVDGIDHGLRSHMDADAFAILLRNLIENAVKHGDPDLPVEVSLPGNGIVSVVNGGPVLAASSLRGLKDRFARVPGAADGAGLGLAIADAIAVGSGGALELKSPASGREDGFEARLRLPD